MSTLTPSIGISLSPVPTQPAEEPTEPVDTPVPEPTATHTPLPTVTSPVPTPTSTPPPSPTPAPLPEPTFYEVQPGDSLLLLADQFELAPEILALANGYESIADFSILAGSEIQIPLCQVHQILPGNTLAGVAQVCGVGLDELITANIQSLAALGSFDAVPIGFILVIPQESTIPEDLDCITQPAREQVIEYTPLVGEGIFCLSQKFTVSTTALIQANQERLVGGEYGQVPLLIPPLDGAIIVISEDEIESETSVADIAAWYAVAIDGIFDWSGNLVEDPLSEGQGLYIPDADLSFGRFQPVQPEAGEGG
jgi:LysM repeat protein